MLSEADRLQAELEGTFIAIKCLEEEYDDLRAKERDIELQLKEAYELRKDKNDAIFQACAKADTIRRELTAIKEQGRKAGRLYATMYDARDYSIRD